MPVSLALIIGIIAGIVMTILMYLLVIPEKTRKNLPGFLQFVHDIVNFKTMLLEPIIKVLYIFCTFVSIIAGILLLFACPVWIGLLMIFIGPLVLRVIYELIMLFVLQVQNTISINRKLK